MTPISDHNPILLNTNPSMAHSSHKRKFENWWLIKAELKQVVWHSWNGFEDLNLINRIVALRETLAIRGSKADSFY